MKTAIILSLLAALAAATPAQERKRGETVIASAGPDGTTTVTIGGPAQTANATAFPGEGETVTASAGPGETVSAFGRRRKRGETVSASAGPGGSTTVTIGGNGGFGGGFQTANGTDCGGQTVTASAGPGETVSASAGPGGSTTVTFMG